MELQFFGASKGVTGSCYSLSTSTAKILVDCGMFQGDKDSERLNYEAFSFEPKEYSALLLTHAHLDHCGRIPHLISSGFKGKIYATEATKALAFIVMADAAHIAQEDTEHENKRRAAEGLPARNPLYTMKDVDTAMNLFETVEYDDVVTVAEGVTAKFYDAGHILGASSIQVKAVEGEDKKTIVFSGDLGHHDSILVRSKEKITEADYVLMESTYGDRLHPDIEERKKDLIRVIKETHGKGGKLIIPVFAIERTQEMLYYIGEFMEEGIIPRMPIFLDSPMAIRSTEVFKKYTDYFNQDVQDRLKKTSDVFGFPELKMTMTRRESMEINSIREPCIILAGSGMLTGGRIKHHVVNNMEDENNTLLFVGFQVEGTLGNVIQGGAKKVNLLGKEIEIKGKIETIEGFSAHADKNELKKWLALCSPKPKVFMIHGDPEQQLALSADLKKDGYDVTIPSLYEKIEL